MDSRYTLSDRLQFHILRHFTRPGEDYLKNFMNRTGYSRKEIEEQLMLPGSKFHENFAADPVQLWAIISDLIQRGCHRAWYSSNRRIFSFEFEKESYPEGIGGGAMVPVAALPEALRSQIREEERDGHPVKTISGIKPLPTWQMHMVIILSADPFIATIFPGIYAPPFPDPKTQDYEQCKDYEQFWKSHTLIN